MIVIKARNVNDALQQGLQHLSSYGIRRDSRNGPVLLSPEPVTTVYSKPLERVLFWPERDANPFFHLYESLWMLAGRNDVEPVARFAKQMLQYSDDGKIFHGAYGYRWRHWFEFDQLKSIAASLSENKDDRRQVLQMWDPTKDLGRVGKDLPCNVSATFQINVDGALDLCVFCRSNDIVWGAYGANAVHFSFLLEYMARWIGVPVGRYSQISINYHGYLETVEPLMGKNSLLDPYERGEVHSLLLPDHAINYIDMDIEKLLYEVDSQQLSTSKLEFWNTMSGILLAHEVWRMLPPPERFDRSLAVLGSLDPTIDFVSASASWLLRRKARWEAKLVAK